MRAGCCLRRAPLELHRPSQARRSLGECGAAREQVRSGRSSTPAGSGRERRDRGHFCNAPRSRRRAAGRGRSRGRAAVHGAVYRLSMCCCLVRGALEGRALMACRVTHAWRRIEACSPQRVKAPFVRVTTPKRAVSSVDAGGRGSRIGLRLGSRPACYTRVSIGGRARSFHAHAPSLRRALLHCGELAREECARSVIDGAPRGRR